MAATASPARSAQQAALTAVGHDSRIDLTWTPLATGAERYTIERAEKPSGPFAAIARGYRSSEFSDFTGANGQTYSYRVTLEASKSNLEATSPVATATTVTMTDDELLTSLQAATFRYFWQGAHPTSGLTRERSGFGPVCATGGTGFGLYAIIIGSERGFVTRAEAAARTRMMLTFLEDKAQRYHGAFAHWIDGATGKTHPFSQFDDGADLIETALLFQGVLAARQYFGHADEVEAEIRLRSDRLWKAVEWDWFLKDAGSKSLYWHWSPNYGWKKNLRITGWNEGMIAYLLAIASPTHPIPADCYALGWAGSKRYVNGREYYGFKQYVGNGMGAPLFFTQYSFVGFDPREKSDAFCDYFENHRNTTLIHRAYAIENPGRHAGYGENLWGLTPSIGPDRYQPSAPGKNDFGTIAPTACLSAMPYAPKESMAALRHLYKNYGPKLWGEYGFRDAFNPDHDWFAQSYLAIDQGPIIAMIENHRTGLCWKLFMANPEIAPMLAKAGFKSHKR
jgi:hypothetical protein